MRNLFLTHAQQTRHKVFEKNISNLEFSTVKCLLLYFVNVFQQKGIYEWEYKSSDSFLNVR